MYNEEVIKIGTDIEHYLKINEKAFIDQPLKHDTEYELKGIITTLDEVLSQKNGLINTYKAEFTGNVELTELRTNQVIKGKGKSSYSKRLHGRMCGYAKQVRGEIDLEKYYEDRMRKLICYWEEVDGYLQNKS